MKKLVKILIIGFAILGIVIGCKRNDSVTGVSLNKSELTLEVGETETLVANVTPTTAKVKDVVWSSSDESVAIVSSNGTVEALSEGEAYITVRAKDGGYSATCALEVVFPSRLLVGVWKEDGGSAILTFNDDDTALIVNVPVAWTVEDEILILTLLRTHIFKFRIVSLTDDSLTLGTAEGAPQVITFSKLPPTPVTAFSLLSSELIIDEGEVNYILFSFTPAEANNKKLIWTSSDETIAEVDRFGIITGIKQGEATITATTVDGEFSSSCIVSIPLPKAYGFDVYNNGKTYLSFTDPQHLNIINEDCAMIFAAAYYNGKVYGYDSNADFYVITHGTGEKVQKGTSN